jgi:hypothetical protein
MKPIIVALPLIPFLAVAQCTPPESRTWIDYTDSVTFNERVWFGFSDSAHYGLDYQLCEFEIPPSPPIGVWDIRFVNIPGRGGWDTPQGLGQGFTQDYRPRSSQDGRDTFRLRFQPGEPGYPVRFRWSILGILSIVDSAWLFDESASWLYWARMHLVDHLVVSNPAFTHLLLTTWRHTVDVNERQDGSPGLFLLHQNFPNPFNPTTTIQFTIVTRQSTIVKVFDVLGREVATLVNEVKEPGTYTVQWDASGRPSGVYFYRLQAGTFAATRKLLLLR